MQTGGCRPSVAVHFSPSLSPGAPVPILIEIESDNSGAVVTFDQPMSWGVIEPISFFFRKTNTRLIFNSCDVIGSTLVFSGLDDSFADPGINAGSMPAIQPTLIGIPSGLAAPEFENFPAVIV